MNEMHDWAKDICIEDLPGTGQELALILGMENFIRLCEAAGGRMFYVPMKQPLMTIGRNKKICDEYRQGKMDKRELAMKYDLSYNQICFIIRENQWR